MVFDAVDDSGQAIYHTNVLMCVATEFAMAGFEMIPDRRRRAEIEQRLAESGHELICLSADQIQNFAGNALELSGRNGRILAISSRAAACLTSQQVEIIERSVRITALHVPTIELAGGRCDACWREYICRADSVTNRQTLQQRHKQKFQVRFAFAQQSSKSGTIRMHFPMRLA